MKKNDALILAFALAVSMVLHAGMFYGFFHYHFRPIGDFEREVRKRFSLKEVDIKPMKTHVEALPVPSTKTFRNEQASQLPPRSTEAEGVRQSMQRLQLTPKPPGTPLLPKANEPMVQLTSPQQPVQIGDTHEKVKQEIIAIQESNLKENRPTIEAAPRAQAQADIVERAGKEEKRLPEEIRDAPGTLSGGEEDALNASLGAAAAGIGMKESSMLLRGPTSLTLRTGEKPYESIEPWLNIEVFTYVDPSGDPTQGFFHLRITPKPNNPLRIIPKDVIFVIDASASITQEKLDRFTKAVSRTLELLNPIDRFDIVTFSDKAHYLQPAMLPVTERDSEDVRVLLGTLRSEGSTDLYGALAPLLSLQPSPGRLLMLFLMSDGKPTAGIVNGADIINRISNVNNNRATIFDFGGPVANRYLLDLLAFRNRGHSSFANHLGDMEQGFVDLYADVRSPLLMNLQFLFSGVDTKQVYPQALPHLYQDSSLDLYGRYNPKTQKTFAFRLVGETYAENKELFVTHDFPAPDPAHNYIPTAWAQNKIYDLVGQLVQQDTPERREQILALGSAYKIQVPYVKSRTR